MTRFDFDVIGESPRIVSRLPDGQAAKPADAKPPAPARIAVDQPPATKVPEPTA